MTCLRGGEAGTRAGRVVAFIAVVVTAACSGTPSAGFWYETGSLVLPADSAAELGGPLTPQEMASVESLSRAEIGRAFSGLRVELTASRRALWRIGVTRSLRSRRNQPLPHAGESVALGILGGTGVVAFDIVAAGAIHYAPPGTPRQAVVDAIGRGIGRVGVHEFMHQILGGAAAHNRQDVDSYEYWSSDRPSQFYGELHWTTAWPPLQRKLSG